MKNGVSAFALAVFAASLASAADLNFEERVQAQLAVERVYYSHQIGATRPFEVAVPRHLAENKVRTYLLQSVALDIFWHTPVTAEMLWREVERQARDTQMPGTLEELYSALGDDPFLIAECIARPALVDRLSRNFYAFDARMHGTARIEAEDLVAGLERHGIGAFQNDRRRHDAEIVRGGEAPNPTTSKILLEESAYARWSCR